MEYLDLPTTAMYNPAILPLAPNQWDDASACVKYLSKLMHDPRDFIPED